MDRGRDNSLLIQLVVLAAAVCAAGVSVDYQSTETGSLIGGARGAPRSLFFYSLCIPATGHMQSFRHFPVPSADHSRVCPNRRKL